MNQSEDDYELEEFYNGFKTSMKNFYRSHTFNRPIEIWSERLNNFKKKEEYSNLQKLIIKIISLYAIDIMRVGDIYNGGILITNIKRFNRITIKNTKLDTINFETNIVFLLLNIFTILSKKDNTNYLVIFNQVELYIIYEDFTNLIEYSVSNNIPSILDKLFNYSNQIFNLACSLYDVNTTNKLSARKFINLIKN